MLVFGGCKPQFAISLQWNSARGEQLAVTFFRIGCASTKWWQGANGHFGWTGGWTMFPSFPPLKRGEESTTSIETRKGEVGGRLSALEYAPCFGLRQRQVDKGKFVTPGLCAVRFGAPKWRVQYAFLKDCLTPTSRPVIFLSFVLRSEVMAWLLHALAFLRIDNPFL